MRRWLDKPEARAKEAALVEARLAPDMFPFTRQFQIASDGVKGAAARLAGVEAPAMPDTETTFDQLQARIDATQPPGCCSQASPAVTQVRALQAQAPVIVLSALAALLVGLGLGGVSRRDIG